jgi:hypothetical protein
MNPLLARNRCLHSIPHRLTRSSPMQAPIVVAARAFTLRATESTCARRCRFRFVAEGGAGANWIRANADRSFGGDSRAVTALLHRLSARALARPSESQTVAAQGPRRAPERLPHPRT